MVLNGFLFGIGLWIALIVVIILFGSIKKITRMRPTVGMWLDYREKCLGKQDYREITFVDSLIKGKDEDETTRLPKGYKIKEKSELVTNDRDDGSMSLSTEKERWIIKVKPRK